MLDVGACACACGCDCGGVRAVVLEFEFVNAVGGGCDCDCGWGGGGGGDGSIGFGEGVGLGEEAAASAIVRGNFWGFREVLIHCCFGQLGSLITRSNQNFNFSFRSLLKKRGHGGAEEGWGWGEILAVHVSECETAPRLGWDHERKFNVSSFFFLVCIVTCNYFIYKIK